MDKEKIKLVIASIQEQLAVLQAELDKETV